MSAHRETIGSPVGDLTLVADAGHLIAVLWPDDDPRRVMIDQVIDDPDDPVLIETAGQLAEYFDGVRRAFDLPLSFRGTAFQQDVWAALLTIAYGETRSYAAIAQAIGRPSACRAVGAANGGNPLSIVAVPPCDRHVGQTYWFRGWTAGEESSAGAGSEPDDAEPLVAPWRLVIASMPTRTGV